MYIEPHQPLFVPSLPLTKAQHHRTVDGSRSKRWSHRDLPPLPAPLHSSQQKVNKAPLMYPQYPLLKNYGQSPAR